jgi:hypothetical protein
MYYAAIAIEGAIAARDEQRDTQSFQVLERRILGLQSDDTFLTGVALRLSTYDPAESSVAPDAALHAAMQAEIELCLGPLLREIRRAIPRRPVVNRTSLGKEIRRRLDLPSGDPSRIELEAALSRLPEPQRVCLATLYGQGGYKELQRRGFGGRRIEELRQPAIAKLLAEVPELTRFYLRVG